jgi:hypothetical protein
VGDLEYKEQNVYSTDLLGVIKRGSLQIFCSLTEMEIIFEGGRRQVSGGFAGKNEILATELLATN